MLCCAARADSDVDSAEAGLHQCSRDSEGGDGGDHHHSSGLWREVQGGQSRDHAGDVHVRLWGRRR